MVSKEHLLIEEYDEYGAIRVTKSGNYRFLELNDGVEQSYAFMPDPVWLEYDCTHAIPLGRLCHLQPRRTLLLGFDAGSLIQAYLRHLSLEEAETIKLRSAIPRLTCEHLGLRDGPHLRLRIGDTLESLGECAEADLIFPDLYTDTGSLAAYLAWSSLGACRERLAGDGWLVINQWNDIDGKSLGAPLLHERYHHHHWEHPVAEGNVVTLAPANLALELDQEALWAHAVALEPQLSYSLQGCIDSLRPAQ